MSFVSWLDKPSKKHKVWRVNFHDHQGSLRRMQGFRSKRSSGQLGKNLTELANAVGSGTDIPDHMAVWLKGQLDSKRRDKLVAWGLLSHRHLLSGVPLVKHIEAWNDQLLAEGNTVHYCGQQESQAKLILIDECHFEMYGDIDASVLSASVASLARRRKWSKSTQFHYTKSAKSFTAWMVKFGRASRNPLAVLRPAKVKRSQFSRPRRALNLDECNALIEKTSESKKDRGGMSGLERALMYRLVIFETGFRAGTLRGLKVGDFDLHGNPPTVTGRVKGGRIVTVPLSDGILGLFESHFADLSDDDRAFNAPTVSWFADVLKMDLDDAEIKYETYSGCCDFHALRHTFATMASKTMDPKSLQEIMGHTDIRITMGYYTHRLTADLAQAKSGMPKCGVQCGGNVQESDTKQQKAAESKVG